MLVLTQHMKVLSLYTPKSSNVMTHCEPLYRDYFSEDHDKSYRSKKQQKKLRFHVFCCSPCRNVRLLLVGTKMADMYQKQ